VAYLRKPFDQESLLDAVNLAARGRAGFQHETRN
jgi:FixJ family two-component response regulator